MEATQRFFQSILLTSLVCLTFGEVAQAQLCNTPACWPGKRGFVQQVQKSYHRGPNTLIGNSIAAAFSDTGGLTNGSTYYYVLRPVDQSGAEVCHSNQAIITIPNLPR